MEDSESSVRNKSPAVGQVHGLEKKSTSPGKKKLRKLRRTDIDWKRKDVSLSLFKAVLAKEPHRKTTNADKNKSWNEVKEMLFQQDFMADYLYLKDSDTIIRNIKVGLCNG